MWWDAWAAIFGGSAVGVAIAALVVAWIGIGVTTASAFAVWKLGVAANEASAEATRIASGEAERNSAESGRREYREETEQLLVLAQITGEVGTASGLISNALGILIGGGVGKQLFLMERKFRAPILKDLDRLTFPMTAAARDRLHYLDRKVAGCLLRATGLMAITQESYSVLADDAPAEDLAALYEALEFLLPLIRTDLAVVQQACSAAMERLGLADVMTARAAAAFDAEE
ncbi:TPA: hypothetical protein QDZ99_003586 [Stenotrophomonas maltophilia]|nr:hypothetical protein [Stenotrophomonas maltophilia]HDS1158293.1 hypothetical protein [Stenotrophomonas maltophilia]HDS1171843.1 hypothetical protein [Stenotrophomonas maltophilia]HDS1176504.1 hypothetical protein [Stenotrophomonas maltophilia]HDS1181886.1 hypothetical protein [Stenotrophomonas maltophilia]